MPEKPAFDPLLPDPLPENLDEDMEDLIELRAAVERNAGRPGVARDEVKKELESDYLTVEELDRRAEDLRSGRVKGVPAAEMIASARKRLAARSSD